jgi:hypothetical protein
MATNSYVSELFGFRVRIFKLAIGAPVKWNEGFELNRFTAGPILKLVFQDSGFNRRIAVRTKAIL